MAVADVVHPTPEVVAEHLAARALLAERTERLLVRHEELQRVNALLTAQVEQLTQERDLMKSRLGAARHRIDALIDRLPQEQTAKDKA